MWYHWKLVTFSANVEPVDSRSIGKLTYSEWKTMTAVFNVNGGAILNTKQIMHLVKFQFRMLYINFWSEHLSVQFDGICFSAVVLPVWTP